jgi:NADH:ubiquinone oxidoreductase subunit 2 (subunit N)
MLGGERPAFVIALLAGGAALALLTPWVRVAWMVAAVASCAAAALSIAGVVSGFAVPNGDAVAAPPATNAYLLALFCTPTALAVLAAGAMLTPRKDKTGPYAVALTLGVGAGWCCALLAEDLFGLFAGVEAAWLAATALVAIGGKQGAANGSLRMLLAGGVGAAFFLCGAALLGSATNSYQLADIATGRIASPQAGALGAGLIVVALTIKTGVAPFTYWIAGAYGRSSAFALVPVGVVGPLGALAALVHFAGYAIQAPAIGAAMSAQIAAIGALAVVAGSLQAIGSRHVRRMLAYIWASHAGVALLCVTLGSPAGLSAALVQMTAMVAATLAVAVGVALALGEDADLHAFEGLARRAQFASAAIAGAMLSFMGAPLTLGFLGRWRLVEVGVGAGWWWVAGAVIVTSLAGVFFGGRLIELMYLRRKEVAGVAVTGPWRWTAAPALIVAIATIATGLAPGLLLRAADIAAARAFGVAP